MSEYVIGNRIRCFGVFENDETPPQFIDPSLVYFKVKDPAGVITKYTYGSHAQIVREKQGHYHVDVDASTHGVWHYTFYSDGTGKAADEKSFTVSDSEFS